jgi:hypothetical protein
VINVLIDHPGERLVLALLLFFVLAILSICDCGRSKDGFPEDGVAEWEGIGQCYHFADRYWSLARYLRWLRDSLGIAWDNQRYWDGQDSVHLTHELPHTKNAQYYKMIGQYDQYRWGWLDYDTETEYSCHRQLYIDCLRGIGFPIEHAPTAP